MARLCLILVLAAVAFAVAFDPSTYTTLYTRGGAPPGWSIRSALPTPTEEVEVRIALQQQNLDKLEEFFWAVSNPKNPAYGKYMTKTQVLDLIAPSPAVHDPVVAWIRSTEGSDKITLVDHRDMLIVKAPVSFIERLFQTTLKNYAHDLTGATLIRQLGDSSIPSSLEGTITLVDGLYEFPPVKPRPARRTLGNSREEWQFGETALSRRGEFVSYNTPLTERLLYNVPLDAAVTNPNVGQGVYSQAILGGYNPTDLKKFDELTGIPIQTNPSVVGNAHMSPSGFGESTLDVQYITGHGQGAPTYFWSMKGWIYQLATEIFSSNVTGYLVTSISYGWPETDQCNNAVLESMCHPLGVSSYGYMNLTNIEFMKLGSIGHSMVCSSGDLGAPGDFNGDCTNHTYPLGPLFPASSPYITSVGATAIAGSGNGIVFDEETLASMPHLPAGYSADLVQGEFVSTMVNVSTTPICILYNCSAPIHPEVPCILQNAIFTTGGGFSYFFPTPSYQQDAVDAYVSSGVKLPGAKFWNKGNRGVPDVGAIGQNAIIVDDSNIEVTGGTSASSPTVAGILTLINDFLLNNGGQALGFANPLLYQIAAECDDCFNDVTSFGNHCTESACCKEGYHSAAGWDPVTGLGSLNYGNIINYLQNNVLPRRA